MSEEYLTIEDIENETSEHFTCELSNGKKVIFRRLTKGEESEIRKKTMITKTVRGKPTQELDTEAYQIFLLEKALVKPQLTAKEIKEKMWGSRADELIILYSKEIGLGQLPENLLQ